MNKCPASSAAPKVLSDYGFRENLPYGSMRSMFLTFKKSLISENGLVNNLYQVGSSSIPGMPGLLGMDMLAIIPEKDWPVSQEVVNTLTSKFGFQDLGQSPHGGEDGIWLQSKDFNVKTEEGTDEPCLIMLHLMRDGAPSAVKLVAFREFCKKDQAAFDAYANIKRELASVEGQLLKDYKMKKYEVVEKIMSDTMKWWSETNQSLENYPDDD